MESRANLLSEGRCSVCPKVGEVIPTVEDTRRFMMTFLSPEELALVILEKIKCQKGKLEVKASELGRRGREEGAIVSHFSTRRQSALLEKVQLAVRIRHM